MSLISKCLVAAPVCAALTVASGYARAENPAVDGNAKSRVESLVTGSIGIREARGAQAHAADVKLSTRPEIGTTGTAQTTVPGSAQVLTDPELPVAPLDNYRLELDNCCGPSEE